MNNVSDSPTPTRPVRTSTFTHSPRDCCYASLEKNYFLYWISFEKDEHLLFGCKETLFHAPGGAEEIGVSCLKRSGKVSIR